MQQLPVTKTVYMNRTCGYSVGKNAGGGRTYMMLCTWAGIEHSFNVAAATRVFCVLEGLNCVQGCQLQLSHIYIFGDSSCCSISLYKSIN